MSALGNLVVSLALDHTQFGTGLTRSEHLARQSLNNIGRQFSALTSAASTLGIAIGAGGFTAWLKSSIDAADALNDLNERTGISIATLSGLQYAAEIGDTSMETLSASVGKLNKAMGDADAGNKTMAGNLAALGITSRDPEQALIQLADAVAAMPDPTRRAAQLSDVLGKSYQDLIPLLSGGGAALRTLIEEGRRLNPITEEMARNADKFNNSMTTFQAQAKGAGTALATEFLPHLNNILEQLTAGTDALGGFWAAMEIGTRDPLKSPGEHLKNLRAEIDELRAKRADIKPTSISHILIAGIDEDIAKAEKFIKYYETMRRQALGLPGKATLAADVKRQRAEVDAALRKGSSPAPDKTGKTATPKLDLIDPFGPARNAALKDSLAQRDKILRQEFDAEARLLDAWGDQTAAFNDLDSQVARQLGDSIGQLYGSAATRAFDAIDQDMSSLCASLEATQDSVDPGRYMQMVEAINALSSARYKLADAELLQGQYAAAQAIISSAEASLQSRVVAGLISESQARLELRDIIGQQGQGLQSLVPQIRAMMQASADPAAVANLQAMIDKIAEMQAIGQQVGAFSGMKNALREYGDTAVDTFSTVKDATLKAMQGMEDGILNFTKTGKLSFRDMANSIIDDMLRMSIRAGITAPLSSMLGSFIGSVGQPANIAAFSSANFSDISAFSTGFADGGIMSDRGALPLNRYAAGGIANTPQLALFGEGRMNEAFVPLPDGRSIPVTMQGGGGVSVTQHITIDARGADAGVEQKIYRAMQQAKDAAVAEINNSLSRGGRTAKLAGVA